MNDKWSVRYGPLAARVLLAHIFVFSGAHKLFNFSETAAYIAGTGLPASELFAALAIAVEVVGGALLLAGYYTRAAALALAAFLVPVTLLFHPFWDATGGASQQQAVEFMKNLAIMGGLLGVSAFGAGELSLDARQAIHSAAIHPSDGSLAEPSVGARQRVRAPVPRRAVVSAMMQWSRRWYGT